MAKTLKQILAEADNLKLCDGIFTRIVKYHGDDIDASAISETERVVLLVWHVSGIIGNGGFRYLFEGKMSKRFVGRDRFCHQCAAFNTGDSHAGSHRSVQEFLFS